MKNACIGVIVGLLLLGCGGQEDTDSTALFGNITAGKAIAKVVWAVNAGGPSVVDGDGVFYRVDEFYIGGQTSSTTDTVSGINSSSLYQTERWGDTLYAIPVTNGSYSITFKLAEIFYTKTGERHIQVDIENVATNFNVDIFQKVGHDAAFDRTVKDVAVTDGELTIRISATQGQAKLSGMIVEGVGKLTAAGPGGNSSPLGQPASNMELNFTSLTENQRLNVGADIPVTIRASDPDGINSVDLYLDGIFVSKQGAL